MIPLMDQNSETGTLSLITGSHLLDLKPPFDLNVLEALPELRALEVKAGQPVIFSENLYHAGYPGTNMKQQRRTLFFSYEPSHHADWLFHCRMNSLKGVHHDKRGYCIDPAIGRKIGSKNLTRRPN